MESEKIINPLDHKDEHDPRFETKKWYIINHDMVREIKGTPQLKLIQMLSNLF